MENFNDFAGRTALVTGAGSGIGAACAQALAARGAAKLFLNDINVDGLNALDLPDTCEVEQVIGSVADEGFWKALEPRLSGLDHAIVNAGIGSFGPLAELTFQQWRQVMDVNLDGAFLTLASSMRAMTAKGATTGTAKGGSVVVVGSSTGVKVVPGTGGYGVAKAAVAHMARMAALEGAPQNIRVNAIAPGGVDTAIWESGEDFNRSVETHGREATIKTMAKTTPSGRFATSDEIAGNILYLLSDAGSNITGHVLVSDGGFIL